MKKNVKSSKSAPTKTTATTVKKSNKDQKKPAVKTAQKSTVNTKTASKKPAKAIETKPVAKIKVVAAPKVAEKKVVAPAKKVATSTVVSSSRTVSGFGKVIEPLSWDAIKPKLQQTPAKPSKKDKEDPADVKLYSIKIRYTVGDRVMHDDFGKGLVRDIIGDFKIRVAFRDFEKILVHGINN